MKHMTLPFQLKSAKADDDIGNITGYAAVFNNVDLGYDVILPGAFTEIVKGRNGRVKMLNQHNVQDPIGTADVSQDDTGLKFDGDIVLAAPSGASTHALAKAGALDGMSIGYDALDYDYTEGGVRRLKSIKLWEISLVTFGMNPLAGVDSVKAARAIKTIREFEDWLRDEGGFTNAQAKGIAVGGYKALQTTRDEGDAEAAAVEFVDWLKTLTPAT